MGNIPAEMDLYELRIDGEKEHVCCPECTKDMSYFSSRKRLLLLCYFCKHEIEDDKAVEYLVEMYSGKTFQMKATPGNGYWAVSDFYPGDFPHNNAWLTVNVKAEKDKLDALLRKNTNA